MDSEKPKAKWKTDRDIINQWIFGKIFEQMKDSLLVEMELEKSNLDGYIGFCYIDNSMGISCRMHSLCKKDRGGKFEIVVNLNDSLQILRYDCIEVMEILDRDHVKSLGLEKKPSWVAQFYESLELIPIRGRKDLDPFRAPGFFDDFEVILGEKNFRFPPEKVWVRLKEITTNENIFLGELLNQPYGDLGVNMGDSINVALSKENSESFLVSIVDPGI